MYASSSYSFEGLADAYELCLDSDVDSLDMLLADMQCAAPPVDEWAVGRAALVDAPLAELLALSRCEALDGDDDFEPQLAAAMAAGGLGACTAAIAALSADAALDGGSLEQLLAAHAHSLHPLALQSALLSPPHCPVDRQRALRRLRMLAAHLGSQPTA